MSRSVLMFVVLSVFVTASISPAADWPAISQSDWNLKAVEGHPNAAAAILVRHGEVHLGGDQLSSHIDIYTRIKILTEEGTDFGSISLPSNDYMRTKSLRGRTHLPGGVVVELPDDAKFKKEFSDYYDASMVSCALPDVVPGAIVEYSYSVYFDSIYYPRMWYFQSELPTLLSQVVFHLPKNVSWFPAVYQTLARNQIDQEVRESVNAKIVTFSLRNAPPVPDEPLRFPFSDLASRMMFVPKSRMISTGIQPIFESWDSVATHVWGNRDYGYAHFLRHASSAKKKAKALASGKASAVDKAEAIYRHVRDEVETIPYGGIWVDAEHEADEVLSKRQGDVTEKALLLHAMLDAVKIDSKIAYSNPRSDGRVRTDVVNPSQFFSVLVVADLDGKRVFLDPSDRKNAFGGLEPGLQGVSVLMISKKEQEWVQAPVLAPEESLREAQVKLTLADDGAVSGTGSLALSGNHAYRRLEWKGGGEEAKTAWLSWIEASFPGFDISELEVAEDLEACQVDVSWAMAQRSDEVLGDEVSLSVAEPLALASNPFTLHPTERRTPVQLSFVSLDKLRLELSWPEGWELGGEPALTNSKNKAGSLSYNLSVDADARTLRVERDLKVDKIEFFGAQEYHTIRTLYRNAAKTDAEELLLVKR